MLRSTGIDGLDKPQWYQWTRMANKVSLISSICEVWGFLFAHRAHSALLYHQLWVGRTLWCRQMLWELRWHRTSTFTLARGKAANHRLFFCIHELHWATMQIRYARVKWLIQTIGFNDFSGQSYACGPIFLRFFTHNLSSAWCAKMEENLITMVQSHPALYDFSLYV